MAHLVLDIETIPDADLHRAEDGDNKVPPPPCNRIVTVGCMLLEDGLPRKLGVVGEGKAEAQILADLTTWLERSRPTIVTWNGRGFDMPVITSRALKHGVPMPWWFSDKNTRYRYSSDGHFDLMDFLADFGASRSCRLDVYAKLVGFPGKVGVDGSLVAGMVAKGKLDEVNTYCLCDVVQTTAVFLRVQLLRGTFTRAVYQQKALALLAFVESDPRLAPVVEQIDRMAFLLGEVAVAAVPSAHPAPRSSSHEIAESA